MPDDPAAYQSPLSYGRVSIRVLTFAFIVMNGFAEDFPFTQFEKVGGEYRLTVGAWPQHYFKFQHSTDLQSYSTVAMALGSPGPTFGYTPAPDALRGFFIAEAVAGWAPDDTDLDGMDDLWELQNGLNPLDFADAGLPSSLQPGMSNVEFYRFRLGLTLVTAYYSAETSVHNSTFALSAETSVYNFPNLTGASIEALSTEVSVYQFPNTTGTSMEAVSAELSIFNAPPFTAVIEAISAEMSVFNTPPVAVVSETFSAEVSVFNTAPFTVTPEALSAEISVFNAYTPPAATHAISLEVSVLKSIP